MAFISKKMINGKEQHYIEGSVRLTGGVKKVSVYLKDYDPKKKDSFIEEYSPLVNEKIKELVIDSALKQYEADSIFTEQQLRTVEEMKLGYKDILKKLTEKQFSDVVDRFTVNFTYESNAIEGNTLTLKDVSMVLLEKSTIKGKGLREIYETTNTRDAMELIFANQFKITESDIKKLHKIAVKNTDVLFGYKKLPNYIPGRQVKTTPPERVAEEMEKLIKWYDENNQLPILKKAAIFHGKFLRIHPFEDGNGRVGRLLVNIMLIRNGYPPLIIRKTQRNSYLSALSASDQGYDGKVCRFLLEKYKDAYRKFFDVYIKYIG